MLVRYQKTEDGRRKQLARIYTVEEHRIAAFDIAPEARSVIRRLDRAGYRGYIVGGAIRDLLLGISPKDYDIATDAHPRTVRRLFRRSRIIGKRFQLVHVYVQNHVVEVSTFRGKASTGITDNAGSRSDDANLFGTMAEDVKRRDFTMNALYYDPGRERLVDYVGGYSDIRQRRLRLLIPVEESFSDDPVRMIRAIRYASTTGFKIPQKVARALRKLAGCLNGCSSSRLTEELFKILLCGSSAQFFRQARDHGLLEHLLPELGTPIDEAKSRKFLERLEAGDRKTTASDDQKRAEMIAALCFPFVGVRFDEGLDPDFIANETFRICKSCLSPLTPPNAVVGRAVRLILEEHGLVLPKRKKHRPGRRSARS